MVRKHTRWVIGATVVAVSDALRGELYVAAYQFDAALFDTDLRAEVHVPLQGFPQQERHRDADE
jgi:hypothetical protein